MGIKVKHSANMTSAAATAAESGRAKRLAQDAALAKNTPQSIQTIAGAHAGAAPMTHASAPLTSASPGAGVHGASLVPGRGGSAARTGIPSAGASRSAFGGGAGAGDYKITGTSIFDDPKDGSEWDPSDGGRWVRPWQPGEKEAEALERTLSVKTPYEKELLDFKNLLAMENDAFSKQLGIASMPTKNQKGDLPPLGNQLQKAYEVVLSTLGAKSRGDSIGLQRIYDGIIGGGATSEAPVEQQGAESTPDIASIYANGGSYFGNGGTNDAPVAVRQPAGAVQTDPAIEDEEIKRQYNWF